MSDTENFNSTDENQTGKIAYEFAKRLKKGDIILLKGSLGSGKSIFVRGAASYFDINEPMPSPTFSIMNEYSGSYLDNSSVMLYHFDLYRINDPYELYAIGFEDYIYSDGISFIEWPEKGEEMIPKKSIIVEIKPVEEIRTITIKWLN